MDKKKELITKVENEYNDFRKSLTNLDSAKVFDKAYEINSKHDIKNVLATHAFSSNETNSLLSIPNTLENIYKGWSKTDFSQSDDIADTIRTIAQDDSHSVT